MGNVFSGPFQKLLQILSKSQVKIHEEFFFKVKLKLTTQMAVFKVNKV